MLLKKLYFFNRYSLFSIHRFWGMSIDEQGSKNDEVFFLGSPIVIPCSIIIGLERNIDSRTKSPLWRGEKLIKRAVPGFMAEGCVEGSGSPEVVAK